MKNLFKILTLALITVSLVFSTNWENKTLNAAFPVKKENTTVSEKAQPNNATISPATEMKTKSFTSNQSGKSGEDSTILLVILAILLPPLAVYLYFDEWNKTCTINLILSLLCGLPGVIHALIVILGKK